MFRIHFSYFKQIVWNNNLYFVIRFHCWKKRELQSEAEQKLSAAQKDAALETLNAVAAKEREMNGQLLQLERENAKLQAKIELLEARLQQQP